MQIRKMTAADVPLCLALYDRYAEVDFLHQKLSEDAFCKTFFEDEARAHKVNFVAEDAGEIIGFSSGALVPSKETGYITFVLTDKGHRLKGIGSSLLEALEEGLKKEALLPLKDFQMIFFNPVALTWKIPGTAGHDHPNAPGVDMASGAHLFFKNEGYMDRVTQNSYYLPLDQFVLPKDHEQKREEMKKIGLGIGWYDPAINPGLEELVEDLGSEDWKRELLGNKAKGETSDPLLVAIEAENPEEIVTDHLGSFAGKVVGFTGPLHVQESGRGYFAGIGVHSAYRRHGLGTSLFSALCEGEKEIGAKFMTLFTGETNPAKRIYRGAGFKIVRSWSDMIKKVTYKAAVFDMDGTVLDTVEDLRGSLQYALEQKGHRLVCTPENVKLFFGSGINVAFLRALSLEKGMKEEDLLKIGTEEEVLPEGVDPSMIPELRTIFAPHYVAHCKEHTGPYAGIVPMLLRLRQKGIKTAVVSNKLDAAVAELVDECFPGAFDATIGEKEGVRRKPAPDMVVAALDEMGVQLEDAVYIGDSEVDIETAVNSHLPFIGVTWGFRSAKYLKEKGARQIVSDAEELVDILS